MVTVSIIVFTVDIADTVFIGFTLFLAVLVVVVLIILTTAYYGNCNDQSDAYKTVKQFPY